jgi:hypothetical protein
MAGKLITRGVLTDALRTHPPAHLLSDEKFAQLDGQRIYLFLVSQAELIWSAEWLESTDEQAFARAIDHFLQTLNAAAEATGSMPATAIYRPLSATTDGWQAVQQAWQAAVPSIDLLECQFHGQNRVSASLDEFNQTHPDWSAAQLKQVQDHLKSVLEAPSRAAFSQRIRRNRERYQDEPVLLRRLNILAQKRLLFTNHFKHPEASAYSAPLDRSMRFLDEKLQSFGQYRAAATVNPMLNAWAIVNNLRQFLPDAQKAGQSLAEFRGVKLAGIPWMEALNLCTVANLADLIPAPI